ncbi:anti-sigma factor family protein [Streptomyces sp. SAS_270]|uniref:anti-sigma factor family protein n=1 Tax=Streptomyces sp. SAS_270 TaxID=3412748 RepID=UPI00403CB3FD
MTSTTDTAGHPDVAEISDLTEGLLPPSRSADVRQHLDGCDLCADMYESLEEIRGLLGTLPGPTRMPDDVAGRIDAALAAEALLNATVPAHGSEAREDRASVSRETSAAGVSPGPADSASSSSPASSSSTSSTSAERPSGHPRGTTGPGRPQRVRRGRRRVAVLGTAFTAAALGLGALLLQTMSDDTPGKPSKTSAQQPGSKVMFSEGKLGTQVGDLLAKGKNTRSGTAKPWGIKSHDTGAESNGVDTLNTPAVHVPECVQQGINSNAAVLAAEKGTYKGTSAYLVVLPDESDNARVTAYVVDATCTKQATAAPGKVLLTRSYPRS